MEQDTARDRELLATALAGDRSALHEIIDRLMPVIQARVARCLLRWRGGNPAGVRNDVEDLVQEVFLSLVDQDGKSLRAWQAERGLSLENFVGLVAERRTVSILRTDKRNPWRENPTPVEELDTLAPQPGPDTVTVSRDGLRRLLGRLRGELSPEGWRLFDLLYIQDMSVTEASHATSRSSAAIYVWRGRLKRLVARLSAESTPAPPPDISSTEMTL